MKKFPLEQITIRIFSVLAISVFVLLFGLSISSSWINDWDLVSEYVAPIPDSLLGNILWMLGFLFLGCLVYLFAKRRTIDINMDYFAAVVSVVVMLFSIYWVFASNTAPQADQLMICMFAEAFDAGDISGLEKGGYVALCPQQLGMITLMRVLFRVFGDGNYKVFQLFNALMVPVLVFSGYRLVKSISKSNRMAEGLYLLLMLLCVPLYCYIPFIYGEISSTAFIMLAAWMLLDYEKGNNDKKWLRYTELIIMSVAMGAAVCLRQNALIFLIAFLIVLTVKVINAPDKRMLIALCAVLTGVILFQCFLRFIYDPVTPEDSHEMPAVLYIAMGVNDDNGMAGWHNWYNMSTFAENDHNVELAKAAAFEELGNFMDKCKADSGFALDFYYRKVSSQWNAPMYQCLAMNNLVVGEQSPFAESVYFGKLRQWIEPGMNIYQLFIYGGVLFLLMFRVNKRNDIEDYLMLIGVFGGFLFSLIWEAKSRYVFPYFVMMIPYASVGIIWCIKMLCDCWYRCRLRKNR